MKPLFGERATGPIFACVAVCAVVSVDIETHELGVELVERHHLAVYDALIVAAALQAECTVLYTEDLQHGQKFGGLTIRNPFVG